PHFHCPAHVGLVLFRSPACPSAGNPGLRHQLGVLQRSVKRPNLTRFDRLLWAAAVTYLAGLAVGAASSSRERGSRGIAKVSACLFWPCKLRRRILQRLQRGEPHLFGDAYAKQRGVRAAHLAVWVKPRLSVREGPGQCRWAAGLVSRARIVVVLRSAGRLRGM